MSTSPSRARISFPAHKTSVLRPQPFPYNTIPEDVGRSSAAAGLSGSVVESSDRLAAETEGKLGARARGRLEGEAEERKVWTERLEQERLHVTEALTRFSHDRSDYFRKVEGEVVQLALSIARKILHRESQIDPLLLAGIVRVALEKLDGSAKVVLRLHPQNAADWRKYLQEQLDPATVPEIVEDASQPRDRCSLETLMGKAVVDVEEQLKEIEKGFMDLLAARPGESS